MQSIDHSNNYFGKLTQICKSKPHAKAVNFSIDYFGFHSGTFNSDRSHNLSILCHIPSLMTKINIYRSMKCYLTYCYTKWCALKLKKLTKCSKAYCDMFRNTHTHIAHYTYFKWHVKYTKHIKYTIAIFTVK